MGFLGRLFKRTESTVNSPRVGEDGFVHAADLSPDELEKIEREGWSGPLPDHGMHATPPVGWRRHLAHGFGVIPSLGADGSGGDSSSDGGGGSDFGSGDGGGSGGGGGDG